MFNLIPKADVAQVEVSGFAKFNGQPHLCVEVPDGGFTITCRTTEGEKVTFAFQPYKEGGPPKCVDIKCHTSKGRTVNGRDELAIQEINVFSKGRDVLRTYANDEKPATLVSLIFNRKE